ncbi:MAG: hypothetical protein RLZZ305_166, partial [Actinomycetota bacterium]
MTNVPRRILRFVPRFVVLAIAALLLPWNVVAPTSLTTDVPAARAAGGPVVLDGMDPVCHSGGEGTWQYITNVLKKVYNGSGNPGNNGKIAILGVPNMGSAGGCVAVSWNTILASKFLTSFGTQASGLQPATVFFNTETELNTFFSTTILNDPPKVIWIPDDWNRSATISNKFTTNAEKIADFVNSGGGLFANYGTFGWLSALFPSAVFNNGGCNGGPNATADGAADFGLTNAMVVACWHGYFTGNVGTLKTLASYPYNGATQKVAIGGGAASLPSSLVVTGSPSSPQVGQNLTITAETKLTDGTAQVGVVVTITVTSGPGQGNVYTGTSNASGVATVTVPITGAGTSVYTATATVNGVAKTVTYSNTSVTPPLVATATTATLGPNQSATVQGSATGTVYLVNSSVTVSNLSSITGAAGDLWNSVSISSANSNTSLALSGLSAGTYQAYLADGSGNLSPASSGTVTVDTTRPTVTITRAGSGAVGVGQTLAITFTLSSTSSDFTLGDIGVSGGTLSGFSGSGTTYTATWTPPTNGSGVENIYVNAGGFTNSLGNTNTASSSLNIVWNANLPSVTITRAGSGTVGGGQDITVTFTLSESSSNFVVGDITVSGGTLSGFASSGPLTYTATWTPPATGSGTASISVAANKFTNSAGNNNTASTALSIAWNTNLPSVTITRAGSGTVGGGQDITVTFELSELSTNFALGDIT